MTARDHQRWVMHSLLCHSLQSDQHDLCLDCFVITVMVYGLPSVLWHCWLGGRASGLYKMGGWWRWALVSLDRVAPIRMVGVSASVNLPLQDKVQKFSSGTGSPGCPRKRALKRLWCSGLWSGVMFCGWTFDKRWSDVRFGFIVGSRFQ